jgi:hypothetical protein
MSSVLAPRPNLSPDLKADSPRIPRVGDLVDLSTLVDAYNRPLANRKFLVRILTLDDMSATPYRPERIARTPEILLGRWAITYFDAYRNRRMSAFLDRPGETALQLGLYDRQGRCLAELIGDPYPQTTEGRLALAKACGKAQREDENRRGERYVRGVFAVEAPAGDAHDDWSDDDRIELGDFDPFVA